MAYHVTENTTYKKAVARIAYRTASQQTIY